MGSNLKAIPTPKRIHQCMSCKFHSGATFCNHWNANDPNDSSFCYDYGDLEEDGPYDPNFTNLEEIK